VENEEINILPAQSSTFLLDMGNVILPFDHMISCRKLADKYDLDADEIYNIIFTSGLAWKFEEGKLTGMQFYKKCLELLKLQIDYNEFRDLWSDIFTEDKEVSKIILTLTKKHELILLSNTNEWHISFVRDKFDIINKFAKYVLSYEVGYMKPHPKIYEIAKTVALHKNNIIYIDDIAEYVESAKKLDITAFHFTGAQSLRDYLTKNDFEL
jgi:HAD superfamily hydrolase (TIGR01509 family)